MLQIHRIQLDNRAIQPDNPVIQSEETRGITYVLSEEVGHLFLFKWQERRPATGGASSRAEFAVCAGALQDAGLHVEVAAAGLPRKWVAGLADVGK